MSRITAIDPGQATGKTKDLFDAVKTKLGMVPNLMRTLGNSPAALEGYLNFSGALGGGALDPKLREEIALAVAQANRCQYCLSAHTAIGKKVGLTGDEISASRRGVSADPKTAAALDFARSIVANAGATTDEEVERVRRAGFSDTDIVEIIAHVALNIFTNYFNIAAGVVVDFPKVDVDLQATA